MIVDAGDDAFEELVFILEVVGKRVGFQYVADLGELGSDDIGGIGFALQRTELDLGFGDAAFDVAGTLQEQGGSIYALLDEIIHLFKLLIQ